MKTTNSFRSKLLALTLAFMASAMSFAQDGYPDFEVDGLYYNFLEGDSVQVTFQMQSGSPIPTTANNISNKKNLSGVGYDQLTELVVPSTVTYEDKTYHVSRIGIAAFLSCVNLAHIDLPTSIKSIGMAAFQSCHALSSITLNEGVESIELQVFANCIKLKEVTLPSTLKSMGRRVFELSKSLSKVVCKATTPPTVEENLLTGSDDTNISNATLYVPVQSLTTYQNTYPWNTFGQILPIEDSFQDIFPTLLGLERTEVEGTTMGFDEPYQMSFSQYTPTLVDGTWYLYDGRNYFREANNQILWYAPEFNITDAVLYDWTLEVGDTLPIYTSTFNSDAKRGAMFRVTDVSTIKLLDGKEYKKWTFSGGYEYVEGIGAINKGFGLYYCLLHNAHPAIYTSTKTICISKNGQLLYQMDEVEMLQNGFECMCELTPAYKDQWCNIWNVVEFDGMRFEETAKTWQYRLAQDTVIDNQIYTFVNCHWTADKNNKYRCAAVRFTEDKKVYVHYLGKEYLLYDFDVQVGDTLEVFAGLNNAYDCLTCTCVVNKVRYSKTNKAIIELSAFGDDDENKYYPFDLRWIEGVGADEGFLMGPVGLNGRVGGYSRLLMCAYQDHQLVYETDNSYLAQFNCEYNAGHEHSSPTLEGLHRTACKEFIGYEGIHETSAIETGKEVLINDKFYKLWDKWLLREENDKIYVYSNKKDILLYDFTLEVGDSLRTLTLHPTIGIIDFPIGTIYPIDTLIVTDISTIKLLDGKEYTKWSFNHGAFEYVKGIGCLDGNFLALAKDIENDGVNTHLVCVSKNGQLLYHMDDAEMARLGTECKQVRYNEALLGKWRDVNGNQTVTITDSIIFLDNRELTLTYTASATQLSVKRLWEYDLFSSENCDYLLWGDTLWIDNFIPSLVATFPPQYEPITLVREKDGPSYKSQWCNQWNILSHGYLGPQDPLAGARTSIYWLSDNPITKNGQEYSSLICSSSESNEESSYLVGGLRFTDDKKVYFYYNFDETEYLLYDFGAEVGDTLELFAGLEFYNYHKTYTHIITGKETLNDGRLQIRADVVIRLDNGAGEYFEEKHPVTWIEGLGSTDGIIFNPSNPGVAGDGAIVMLCAYRDDECVYTTNFSDYKNMGCVYNNDGTIDEDLFPMLSGLQRTLCNEYCESSNAWLQTFDEILFEHDYPYIYCNSAFLLREENNKVLIYSHSLDKDLVLYDFTLEVGDSLPLLYLDEAAEKDLYWIYYDIMNVVDYQKDFEGNILPADTLIVTDVSIITLLDGKQYKKWTFNNGMEYVEGIGTYGTTRSGDFFELIANQQYPTSLHAQHLVCVSKNGQLLYKMDNEEMERLGTECLCAQPGKGETDNAKDGKIGGRPTPTQWYIVEINQEVIHKLPAQRSASEESSILSAETFIYTLENDSLRVNGKKYFHLDRHSSKESPDTKVNVGALHFGNDDRVWFYHDNAEYLLYDFSAEVGDTLQLFAGIHNYPTDSVYTHVVTAKDTIEEGITRVTLDAIIYELVDGQLTEQHWEKTWLAGLGSTDGIVHNSAKRASKARNNIEQSHLMLCAWRDDECLYTTNHPDFINVGCEYNHDFTVLEDIHSSGSNYQKLIRDGQLFIIHNGRTYNVLGVQQ